jgi:pyrroline-5-carboxylate reductase
MHIGPIAVFPRNETVSRIFNPLGTVIAVEQEAQLEPLMVITGLMAPYYAMLETVVTWAEDVGVDRGSAAGYAASMFGALSAMAGELEDGKIDRLVTESMTPGGLNELAQNVVREKGSFSHIREALAAVQRRFGT